MNQADGIIAVNLKEGGYGIYIKSDPKKPLFTLQSVEHLGQQQIDIRLHLSPLFTINQIVSGQTLMEYLNCLDERGDGLTIVRFDPLMNEAIVGYTSFHEYQGISFERYCDHYRIRIVVMEQVFLVTVLASTLLMALKELTPEVENAGV